MTIGHARRDSILKYSNLQIEAKRRLIMGKIIPWGKVCGKKTGE